MIQFSEKDILKFLDTLSEKHSIPISTAAAQKAAVSKVLSALDENEKTQLFENMDLEDLIARFQNKSKHDLNTESLRTYIGRFKTAFFNFIEWNKNPSSFKPKIKRGRPSKSSANKVKKNNKVDNQYNDFSQPQNQKLFETTEMIKYPIKFENSPDGFLQIPRNLASSEVDKIIPFLTSILKLHIQG